MDRAAAIERLENLTRNQKILIVAGTIVAVLAIYWFLFFSPGYEHIKNLKKDVSDLQDTIEKKRQQIPELKRLEAKLKRHEKEKKYAWDLLPDSQVGIENLLSQIEQLGKQEGVEFISFVPQNESVKEFYATRGVKLQLIGPFHNLMTYFNKLSSLNRLVTLEDLQLSPKRGSEATVLRTDCKINLYRTVDTDKK